MRLTSTIRAKTVSIAASIVLLLVAMMLPVCHLHPLLDKSAPEHCTICMSLHAAAPVGVHIPSVVAPPRPAGRVVVVAVPARLEWAPSFAASRAPPLPAC